VMTMAEEQPEGVVGLANAIAALRDELIRAWSSGQERRLRFKPAPVELTLQVALTSAGKGRAGIRWWLVELGGEMSRESVVTQTLKLRLDPVMYDEQGQPTEVLIYDVDAEADRLRSDDHLRDPE
jgi:Trypsin-co-occurring domain 2